LAAAASADSVDYFTAGFMAADFAGLAAMVAVGITPERSMADGTEDMVPTFMPVDTGRGMAATDIRMAAMAAAMVVAMAVAMVAAMVAAMATADITTAAMAAADITTAAMATTNIPTLDITATTVVAIRVSAIAVGHGDPASVSFVSQTAAWELAVLRADTWISRFGPEGIVSRQRG
jgi:hypothetical protein